MASNLLRVLSRGRVAAQRVLSTAQPTSFAAARTFSTTVEEDVVKEAFVKQQTQFRQYLQGLASVPIPLNPDDDKAVIQYADAVRKLREKVGVKAFTEKMADLLESAEEDSSTVRGFLEDAVTVRKQLGIEDSLGLGSMMYAALDTVEKKLGKPLTTSDPQGLAAFQSEVAAINSKLGLNEADLEKMEGEVDVMLAKGEIAEMRKEALDKINTYKRRDSLEDVDIDLKELKPTTYL